jgi:DNA-binding NarL/FixJ family response regulator
MSTVSLGPAAGRHDLDEPAQVLIVDDHAVVRQGLRTFLELQDEPAALPIVVVGEAANGVQAVDLARRLQPDLVLLDLVVPDMNGIEAISHILEVSPHSRVIILTSFGEEDQPSAADG